jgi:hypothetical protein
MPLHRDIKQSAYREDRMLMAIRVCLRVLNIVYVIAFVMFIYFLLEGKSGR